MIEGRYTRIRNSFWMDEKVQEWPGETKLLALYLLTSPHNNMLGCYYLPRLYICGDLGWELGRLSGPFERLLADGFIKYDERCRLVILAKYLRHNPLHNGNRAKAAIKLLQGLPKSSLLNDLKAEVEQQGKPYLQQLAQALGRLAPTPPEQRLAKPVGEPIGEPLGEPMGEPYAKPSMEWFGIPFEEPIAEPFDKPMGERYAKPTTTATASTANTTVTANINMPAAVNIAITATAVGAASAAANLPVASPEITPAAANIPATLPAATAIATATANHSAGLCALAHVAPEGTLSLEAGHNSLEPAPGPKSVKGAGAGYAQDFEYFWSVYPRQLEKRAAHRAWQARVREGAEPGQLIAAARHYVASCRENGTEHKFIKHPKIFLGPGRPYEDYILGPLISRPEIPREPKGFAGLREYMSDLQREGKLL